MLTSKPKASIPYNGGNFGQGATPISSRLFTMFCDAFLLDTRYKDRLRLDDWITESNR